LSTEESAKKSPLLITENFDLVLDMNSSMGKAKVPPRLGTAKLWNTKAS